MARHRLAADSCVLWFGAKLMHVCVDVFPLQNLMNDCIAFTACLSSAQHMYRNKCDDLVKQEQVKSSQTQTHAARANSYANARTQAQHAHVSPHTHHADTTCI